jgi:single-strand DNA-binding protein
MSIQIQLTGHLGRAAEVKTTANGKTFTNLVVASTPRKKINGEWADGETVWFNVTYWGSLPEVVYDKGVRVVVIGTLETKTYEKDGQERKSLIITAETVGTAYKDTNPVQPKPAVEPSQTFNESMPF